MWASAGRGSGVGPSARRPRGPWSHARRFPQELPAASAARPSSPEAEPSPVPAFSTPRPRPPPPSRVVSRFRFRVGDPGLCLSREPREAAVGLFAGPGSVLCLREQGGPRRGGQRGTAGRWSRQDTPRVYWLSSPSSVGAVCGALVPGSPTSTLRSGTDPWPVGNRAAQQEASGRRASEAPQCWPHPSAPPQVPRPQILTGARSLGPRRLGTAALKQVQR